MIDTKNLVFVFAAYSILLLLFIYPALHAPVSYIEETVIYDYYYNDGNSINTQSNKTDLWKVVWENEIDNNRFRPVIKLIRYAKAQVLGVSMLKWRSISFFTAVITALLIFIILRKLIIPFDISFLGGILYLFGTNHTESFYRLFQAGNEAAFFLVISWLCILLFFKNKKKIYEKYLLGASVLFGILSGLSKEPFAIIIPLNLLIYVMGFCHFNNVSNFQQVWEHLLKRRGRVGLLFIGYSLPLFLISLLVVSQNSSSLAGSNLTLYDMSSNAMQLTLFKFVAPPLIVLLGYKVAIGERKFNMNPFLVIISLFLFLWYASQLFIFKDKIIVARYHLPAILISIFLIPVLLDLISTRYSKLIAYLISSILILMLLNNARSQYQRSSYFRANAEVFNSVIETITNDNVQKVNIVGNAPYHYTFITGSKRLLSFKDLTTKLHVVEINKIDEYSKDALGLRNNLNEIFGVTYIDKWNPDTQNSLNVFIKEGFRYQDQLELYQQIISQFSNLNNITYPYWSISLRNFSFVKSKYTITLAK